MMSCGNCGATVQDDALFCPECGAKFVEEPQAQPQPQPVAQPQPTPQPVPQPVPQPQINYAPQQPAVPQYQPQPAAMPGQMTPRQAMLRGVAGSGTMFTSAVFMTASYALSIILVVLSLVSIVTNSFIPKEIVITQALSSGTTLILTAGIAFLFCFSLFTIHSWSKRTDKLAPSFGLTVLKVFSAFGIVGISFAIMLTLILFIIALIGTIPALEYTAAPLIIALCVFAVMALIVALMLTYYIKMLGIFKGAHQICRTGNTNKKPAGFVVVLNWIFAVFGIIGVIFSIASMVLSGFIGNAISNLAYEFNIPGEVYASILSIFLQPVWAQAITLLGTVAQLVAHISMTLTISKYNKGLRETM